MKNTEFIISVVLTVGTAFVIALWVPGQPSDKLKFAFQYGMLILLFLFGFMILAAIASGKIDISTLLTEHGGGASMSRFQLLIFTFVIALSFFLIVVCECKFPEVPANVLALLGISATTYGVSKGIQASSSSGLQGKGGPATGSDGAGAKAQ
jgi:hypothetical protein